MKKIKFLGLVLASAFALGFVSCGDKNDIDGSASLAMDPGSALVIDGFIDHDPTAAYPLSLTVVRPADRGVEIAVRGGKNLPTQEALNAGHPNTYCQTQARFAEYPKVNGLKSMDYATAEGLDYVDTCVNFEDGKAYVVKAIGKANSNALNNSQLHDPAPLYVRLYCKEEKDGTFKLYYQYPFLPEE